MADRIVCFSLPRLRAGMCLGRDLLRADGAVLMPAGTVLDDEMIHSLGAREIEAVFVRLAETRDAPTLARDLAAAELRLRHIFRSGRPGESGECDERSESHGGESRNALFAALLARRRGGAA